MLTVASEELAHVTSQRKWGWRHPRSLPCMKVSHDIMPRGCKVYVRRVSDDAMLLYALQIER